MKRIDSQSSFGAAQTKIVSWALSGAVYTVHNIDNGIWDPWSNWNTDLIEPDLKDEVVRRKVSV